MLQIFGHESDRLILLRYSATDDCQDEDCIRRAPYKFFE